MDLGLHLVTLEITGRCNLSCSHCYRGTDASIDLINITLLLSQLAEIKPYYITISGGEPLLLKDIFSIAEKLKKVCKKLLLTTNGTLVQDFPKNHFEIFDEIQISLDGDKIIHEYIRGKNTFERAIKSAKYLKDIVHVSFLCTVHAMNYHEICNITQIARTMGVSPKLGRMCGFGQSNLVPVNDPIMWKNMLEKAARQGVPNDDPLNFWLSEKKKKCIQKDRIVGGCTAGIAGVAISPELDVYPCVKLRIPAGNLKEQSLKDIWLNSPLFASLRDWHNLKGHCPSCEYVSICRGCRADAWARTGDYLAPDPLCWLNGRGEE